MDNTFEEKLIDKLPGPNIITADLYKDYLIAGDNKGTVYFLETSKPDPSKNNSDIIFMKKLGNIQLNKKIDQICVSKSNDNPIVFILYDGSIDVYQIKTLDKISSLKNSFPQSNISLISTNSKISKYYFNS